MTKADLHRLVDELPDEAVDVAARLLEHATEDPMMFILDNAPFDDEPVTSEEEAQVAEARKSPAVPIEDFWKELKA